MKPNLDSNLEHHQEAVKSVVDLFNKSTCRKHYKDLNIINNTLSPRYLFGHAGLYIFSFLGGFVL